MIVNVVLFRRPDVLPLIQRNIGQGESPSARSHGGLAAQRVTSTYLAARHRCSEGFRP
jgi:hypothetical protein